MLKLLLQLHCKRWSLMKSSSHSKTRWRLFWSSLQRFLSNSSEPQTSGQMVVIVKCCTEPYDTSLRIRYRGPWFERRWIIRWINTLRPAKALKHLENGCPKTTTSLSRLLASLLSASTNQEKDFTKKEETPRTISTANFATKDAFVVSQASVERKMLAHTCSGSRHKESNHHGNSN